MLACAALGRGEGETQSYTVVDWSVLPGQGRS